RTESLDLLNAGRGVSFSERKALQRERLGLPPLPTTVVGSFPQHAELRAARQRHRRGELDAAGYDAFLRTEIQHAVRVQEAAGVDVPAHGEFERTDMVEYFAERFEGYAFTRHGWVQSF